MGHKVHPKIHRIPFIYNWESRWFSNKNYAQNLEQDIRIREHINKKLKSSHIDSILVERTPKNLTVTILAAKPGFIIGRGGKGIDELRKEIERKFLKMSLKVRLNVKELRSPALSAKVTATTIAEQIEKRFAFRRVMKQTIEKVMQAGAQGIKISLSGRLNGVEIARNEKLFAGKVPLITLRSDVDYALVEADTIYGKIGVKVWLYHGEIFSQKDKFATDSKNDRRPRRGNNRNNKNSYRKKIS
ncbi:MAG: 30S ribosomal protein S3 [Candidatus Magasanikbacteria bacterium]|nr:30S ribosomal protein S3 [Candidatus Magasanikbacteria bacterium]